MNWLQETEKLANSTNVLNREEAVLLFNSNTPTTKLGECKNCKHISSDLLNCTNPNIKDCNVFTNSLFEIQEYNISDIAKDYNLTGAKLNIILQQKGIIYTSKKNWYLCDAYKKSNIAKEITTEFNNGYHVITRTKLKWTVKGKKFINDILINNI